MEPCHPNAQRNMFVEQPTGYHAAARATCGETANPFQPQPRENLET